MRIPLWFLLGLFLVALVASFEAAPRLILLGPGGPRPGSFLDNGSLGSSVLASILEKEGASLGVGVEPPRDWRGPVVYLFSGPMSCSVADAAAIADVIKRVASSRPVGIVAASSGNYTCGTRVVEKIVGYAPVAAEQAAGLYLLLPGGAARGPLVLYNPDRLVSLPRWIVEAEAVNENRDRLPGLLSTEVRGVRVILIPDWPVFSNALLRAEQEAGLDPAPAIRGIFSRAAGVETLQGVLVLQPTIFLPKPEEPMGAVIYPGVALARAAEEYARTESSIYEKIIYNPFVVLVAAVAAAGVYYLASLSPGDRSLTATREAPEEEGPGASSSPVSAEEALAALREASMVALGVEPGKVAEDEALLAKLSEAAGVPPRLARRALLAAQRGRPPRLGAGRVRDAALALAEALAHWRMRKG